MFSGMKDLIKGEEEEKEKNEDEDKDEEINLYD